MFSKINDAKTVNTLEQLFKQFIIEIYYQLIKR